MTHPTRAIYYWLMTDFIRVSALSRDHQLFTEQDIKDSLAKIEVINFHEEVNLNGIKFTAYFAGHVLGACMYDIEIAGVRVSAGGFFLRFLRKRFPSPVLFLLLILLIRRFCILAITRERMTDTSWLQRCLQQNRTL